MNSNPLFALAGLSLSMLMASLGTSIVNVALPTLGQAFDATFQEVQWISLAYLLVIAALIVSAGRLGDILGCRRLLLGGIGIFTVASVLCSIAPVLWLLIAARAAQGLGAAILLSLTMALVRETVAVEKTGRAMGLLGTMSAVGTTLGPSLGGVLISWFGWQSIFFVNVPLGILTFHLAYRYLPVHQPVARANGMSLDKRGTLLLTLTLAAYALAMTIKRESFGALNISLLLAAVFGLCLFIFNEIKVPSPLIQLKMFRDPLLSANLAMNTLVSTVMMATLVVGPFYLTLALQLTPVLVGAVMSAGPLVSAFTGVPAGRIVDRFGARRMIVIGLGGMAAGSFLLSLMPTTLGIFGYLGPIAIMTSGYAMFQAANNTAVMKDVSQDKRGLISGLLNLSRNLGLVTGVSFMGAVYAFASNTNETAMVSSEAAATGMRVTFGVATALVVLAIGIDAVSRVLAGKMENKESYCP